MTTNPYTARTDESLAELVTKLAGSIRSFSSEDREQLLAAVADRLTTRGSTQPIDLGGRFTFVPKRPSGDLLHPEGKDGVFITDVDQAEAVKVVEAMTKLDWWDPR